MSEEHLPPKWATRFLHDFCPEEFVEEIEGDLVEKFNRDREQFGLRKARLRYVWNVVRFFRPGILLRNRFSRGLNNQMMLKNRIYIAWRHLRKDWTFSLISVIGLSISMAVFILISQFCFFELGYDEFNKNAQHTYRVTTTTYESGQVVYSSALSPGLASQAIKIKLPEISQCAQLMSTRNWFDCTVTYNDGGNTIVFNERNLFYATPSLLEIFSFPITLGDGKKALARPFSAVLSASTAKRYFGNTDPIGKVLHLKGSGDENDYTVSGVMADIPPNSHIEADILLSISSIEGNPNFRNYEVYTYVQLISTADVQTVQAKMFDFAATDVPQLPPVTADIQLELQPLKDIHLYSSLQDEIKPGGDPTLIYFLLLVATSILLIAWINYVNLATSRSMSRAKEVGIRKVCGASRLQLIFQLLYEAVIINTSSVLLALLLVYLFSPLFYRFTELTVSNELIGNLLPVLPANAGLALGGIFIIGVFISGFYPAKIISSHNPALVLKGKLQTRREGLAIRKALVVFQFTCSIALTIAVLTFDQQFRFMQRQDLGVNIQKTLIVKAPTTFATQIPVSYIERLASFKKALQMRHVINSVTTSSAIPGEKIGWTGFVKRSESDSEASLNFIINVVDTDFVSAYGLRLLAGRNFDVTDYPGNQFGNKTEPIILNKTAAAQLGFDSPERIVGESIYWGKNKCVVIGVIDDFHQQSLKDALQPILFTANNGPLLSIKLGNAVNPANLSESVAAVEQSWKSFFPDSAFDYFFLDDFYTSQYSDERRVMNLFQVFCTIAILISALGLFGLAAYTARQRTKEVSIRKVLGAGVTNLISLLTKEFLALILISSTIAIPLSYLVVERWLDTFVFHTNPSVWAFVIPVIMIMAVTILTVTAQTLRAVYTNPVETLKCE